MEQVVRALPFGRLRQRCAACRPVVQFGSRLRPCRIGGRSHFLRLPGATPGCYDASRRRRFLIILRDLKSATGAGFEFSRPSQTEFLTEPSIEVGEGEVAPSAMGCDQRDRRLGVKLRSSRIGVSSKGGRCTALPHFCAIFISGPSEYRPSVIPLRLWPTIAAIRSPL